MFEFPVFSSCSLFFWWRLCESSGPWLCSAPSRPSLSVPLVSVWMAGATCLAVDGRLLRLAFPFNSCLHVACRKLDVSPWLGRVISELLLFTWRTMQGYWSEVTEHPPNIEVKYQQDVIMPQHEGTRFSYLFSYYNHGGSVSTNAKRLCHILSPLIMW